MLITLVRDGKQFRTDSSLIRLTYYLQHSDVAQLAEVRGSLLVCNEGVEYEWLFIISTAFVLLSLCGLGFIILTYFKFEKIRNVPGKNLVNCAWYGDRSDLVVMFPAK